MMMSRSKSLLLLALAFLALLNASVTVQAELAIEKLGPHKVAVVDYTLSTLVGEYDEVLLAFPTELLERGATQKYPLVVFAHGYTGGGKRTYKNAQRIIDGVASFGYIVAIPKSCPKGCRNNWIPGLTALLRFFPWLRFLDSENHKEVLKTLDWVISTKDDASQVDDEGVMNFVDHDAGYGIFGYSMGGEVAARALAEAEPYDVRAGVILHPAPTGKIGINIPVAAFTSEDDDCCGFGPTYKLFNAATGPKTFANRLYGDHDVAGKGEWSLYTTAWFNIFLKRDLQEDTGRAPDFSYDLIYGDGPKSLCDGPVEMQNCESVPP